MCTSLYAPDFLAIINRYLDTGGRYRPFPSAINGFTSSWSIVSTIHSRHRAICRSMIRITTTFRGQSG